MHEPVRRILGRPAAVVVAVVGLAVVLAVPGWAASDVEQELQQVKQRLEALRGELDAATARYDRVTEELTRTEERLGRLKGRASELEARMQRLSGRLATRARALYKQGGDTTLSTLVSAEGPQDIVERAGWLAVLQSRDDSQLQEAANLRKSLGQTRRLLADTRAELERLQGSAEAERDNLESKLNEARQLASGLRSRAERRRRIDRGVQSGIYSCLFEPEASTFRDTWGAPRSGGRRHEGTDIFAAYEAPVYAFTDGVISRMGSSGLGGTSVYLQGDDGNTYYYAHLAGYADDLYSGKRVTAGEHIAYNGASGNASLSAPHVHLEVMPGGGEEINPYPLVAAACR